MPTRTYKGLDKCLKPIVRMDMAMIRYDESVLIREVDNDHVNNLETSLMELGQVNAIIIEKKGNIYRPIAHIHEFLALNKIYERVKEEHPSERFEIYTRCFEGNDEERLKIQLCENISRKCMEMGKVGEHINRLMNMNLGASQGKLAKELGCTQSYVSQCHATYLESININGNGKRGTVKDDTPKRTNDDTEPQNPDDPTPDPPGEGSQFEPSVIPQAPIGGNGPPANPTPPKPPETPKKDKKVKEEKPKPAIEFEGKEVLSLTKLRKPIKEIIYFQRYKLPKFNADSKEKDIQAIDDAISILEALKEKILNGKSQRIKSTCPGCGKVHITDMEYPSLVCDCGQTFKKTDNGEKIIA